MNKDTKQLLKTAYKNLDIRRIEALDNIMANRGAKKGEAMRKAEYSKAYSKNPKQFLNAKKTKELLGWIDYELEQIAKRMEKTRNKAKYKELSDTFVNLKKLNQLLGGNATERIVITEAEKQEIDDAFDNV